ncbi:MAG: hypothetical protein KAH18_07820 [Psychromonas sp.]|nr:hypothetical protein [Psychromonas sp.]
MKSILSKKPRIVHWLISKVTNKKVKFGNSPLLYDDASVEIKQNRLIDKAKEKRLASKHNTHEKSSMIFLMYRSVHGPDEVNTFSESEKYRLQLSMEDLIIYSLRALDACVIGKGDLDGFLDEDENQERVRLAFGVTPMNRYDKSTGEDSYSIIKQGLKKMHFILTDKEELLIFCDMRAKTNEDKVLDARPMKDVGGGAVLRDCYDPSGYTVYVNSEMLIPARVGKNRAFEIYAALAWQILDTSLRSHEPYCIPTKGDHASNYAKLSSAELARHDSLEALSNAYCWASFVFSYVSYR